MALASQFYLAIADIGVLINYLRAVNVNVSEDSFSHASLNQLAIAEDPNVNPRRKSLGNIISQLTNPLTHIRQHFLDN